MARADQNRSRNQLDPEHRPPAHRLRTKRKGLKRRSKAFSLTSSPARIWTSTIRRSVPCPLLADEAAQPHRAAAQHSAEQEQQRFFARQRSLVSWRNSTLNPPPLAQKGEARLHRLAALSVDHLANSPRFGTSRSHAAGKG